MTHNPLPSRADLHVMGVHGLSLTQWNELPAIARQDYRENIAREVTI
jgi:hypothetical protein